MITRSKDKRKTLNLMADDFDFIKSFCDDRHFKMHSWVGSVVKGIIQNTLNEEKERKNHNELADKHVTTR